MLIVALLFSNHRIAFAHSVSHVQEHITRVVSPFAKKFDLPLHAFSSKNESDRGERYLSLDVFGEALEPAPRTPTSGDVWELFSGSVRHVHKDSSSLTDGGEATPYIVSPFASTGNTDTKVYWNLTRNIFRYMGGPVAKGYSSNAHTVNEKTRIDDHLKISEWIHTIVQNAVSHCSKSHVLWSLIAYTLCAGCISRRVEGRGVRDTSLNQSNYNIKRRSTSM